MQWEFIEEFGKLEFGMQDNNFYMSNIIKERCFIEAPEFCSLMGAYPKADSSHGFPMY